MNIQGEDTSSNWDKVQELGQGGFGNVCLYRNTTTGEHIAIKKLLVREEFADFANRVWERWRQEVYLMKKLDHNCVIRAIAVPQELDGGPEDVPALGMEYCNGGDLRKLISRPENCCGLREVFVRDLLSCIGSAIEYLHSKRIYHRDIKPENIVLQPNGTGEEDKDRFLYKIIDLGYAKELDASSSCMLSHVGTQQYLAPELNGKKAYTRTVDYWSFGTVVFECITGKRPFLPDLRITVQWFEEVSKKSPEDITAFYDERSKIRFSKKIPGPTSLCSPLKNFLEQWLKLMLRWDSKSRGGGVKKVANEERPKCFCVLEQILEMKLFHVMFAKANKLLSFSVNVSHNIETVHGAIQVQTRIPVAQQLLVSRNGVALQPEHLALDYCQDSTTENPAVFLFCQCDIPEDIIIKNKLPGPVEVIVKEPQTVLNMERHKKAWKNVVYFCAIENQAFKQLDASSIAAMKSLLYTYTILVKQKASLKEEMIKLMAYKEYFLMSLNKDVQHCSSNDHGVNGLLQQNWLESSKEAENIDNLNHQVVQLSSFAEEHMQAVLELQRKLPVPLKGANKLDDCEKEAKNLYDKLRAVRGSQEMLEHGPMVDIIGRCLVVKEGLTKNLFDSIDKIMDMFHRLKTMLPDIEATNTAIQSTKQKLLMLQAQRQEDVWKLSNTYESSMQSLNLTADASMTPVSLWNGNDNNASLLRSMSAPMESIRLVDNCKSNGQKLDDLLESMEKDHEESMKFFSAVIDVP